MNFNKDNEQKLVNNRHKENTQATNCDRIYVRGERDREDLEDWERRGGRQCPTDGADEIWDCGVSRWPH